jgi:hypothetical protein
MWLAISYAKNRLEALSQDDEGMGTLEIVLIVAVLIALVVLFKDQIVDLIGNLMDKWGDKTNEVFDE